jgi:hypothetical protein
MVLCFIAALERGFVRVLRTNAGQRVVLSGAVTIRRRLQILLHLPGSVKPGWRRALKSPPRLTCAAKMT